MIHIRNLEPWILRGICGQLFENTKEYYSSDKIVNDLLRPGNSVPARLCPDCGDKLISLIQKRMQWTNR